VIPVGNVPRGLLALLDATAFGNAPPSLAEQIIPTLDLRELFLLNRPEVITGSIANVNAIGDVTTPTQFQVPVGELWYVWSLTVNALTLAGQTLSYAPALYFLGNSQTVGEYVTSGPGESWKTLIKAPFWARSQSRLLIHVSRITGGPVVTTDLNAVVTRLRS